MSDFLPARSTGGSLSRSERRVAKERERIQTSTAIEVSRVRAIEAVEAAKAEAIGAVATVGLIEVSNLSATEAALFERTPHAAPRLKLVADSASAGIAQVVTSMNRSLR
jgi:hypothetical protein